ncbi:hypothetical protein L0222_26110 [bacterium]|nr:hypothetical protein [bacterium]
MIVVSNSSPLIVFARLNLFHILRTLFTQIHISDEVFREVTFDEKQPGAIQVKQADWIHVKAIKNMALHSQLSRSLNLGAGEIASVILAQELSADLVLIDERKARLLAQRYRVAVMGSVGILDISYGKGLINDLRRTYLELEQHGIRVDRRILNHSLAAHNLPPL